MTRCANVHGMAKDQRHRHPYPRGTRREATPKWKQAVLAWMESNDVSYANLSAMVRVKVSGVKVDPRGLQKFLTTDQRTGAYVEAIADITGVGLPTRPAPRDDLDRAIETLDEQRDREAVLAFIKTMLGVRAG